MGFAPRDLLQVPIGRHFATLYPVIDPSMPVYERAHAFQVNKTAIMELPVDLSMKLNALGSQLNASASVEGIKADWMFEFSSNWMNPARMTILSFHNTEGTPIRNTVTAADSAVLKPIVDGPAAANRRADVKFVRVQLNLDFAHLVTIQPPGLTTLKVDYYIQLPQNTVMFNDGINPVELTTYTGPADLRTLTLDQMRTDILEPCLQDSPVLLRPSDFNLRTARTDSNEIMELVTTNIMKLALPQIFASLFNDLCPNYSDQPHAAVEHIRQTYHDADGTSVTSNVHSYYQRMMNAARPFVASHTFPVSICNRFIDGLDPRLLPGFRKAYPQYSDVQRLDGSHQRRTMTLLLKAATQAEDDYRATQQIARDAVVGQAFYTTVGSPPLSSSSATAFPSQAETTLAKYQSPGASSPTSTPRRKLECFGCGQAHAWGKRDENDKKSYIIVCPNKDKPGVMEKAKKQLEEFRARMQRNKSGSSSSGSRTKRKNINSVDFSELNDEAKERIKRQVLAEVHTSTTAAPSNAAATSSPHRVFLMEAVTLANTTRQTLPVTIEQTLPHITLQLGQTEDNTECAAIRCVVDTAAALTTGNFYFFANLAKLYPQCLSRLYVPEEYSPIVLSGIVQRSTNEVVTTELTVGFEFHMPYLTRQGQTTSLIVATGPNVTVNAILGIPFIRSTGMIVDTNDDTIIMKTMDCIPFKIDYRRAQNTIPSSDVSPSTLSMNGSYKAIIEEIENLEAFFTSVPAAPITRRGVSFDADQDHIPEDGSGTSVAIVPAPPPTFDINDSVNDMLMGNNIAIM